MDYIRITEADNGFMLSYTDPEIREQNRKSDSSWQDPERQRVYETAEAMLADLQSLLPGLTKKKATDSDVFNDAVSEAFSKAGDD